MLRLSLLVSSISLLLLGCQPAVQDSAQVAADPEATTAVVAKQKVVRDNYMVAAATADATEAGARILAAGGTAIDAAVAVQAMLTLTEPQSSGIGGGAFILYWDQAEQKLYTIDARETAPAAATPKLFYDAEGNPPSSFWGAVIGGRSVGAPGVIRGLELAHQEFGQLPWADLFSDTIAKAENGFVVGERLAQLLQLEINPGLRTSPTAKDYFYPNDQPLAAGTIKRNPEFAHTLRLIAEQGADGFYQGEIAAEIVKAVSEDPRAQGLLSLADLSNYQAKFREPVCNGYRVYQVCGMGPPSSGGVTVLQILGILESFEISELEPNSSEFVHLFTQASRLAFADRNRYLADQDFIDVPIQNMLDKGYLAERAGLISETDMGKAAAGDFTAYVRADDQSPEFPNTSHFSIVDQYGNAVAITTSIEMGFGSTVMAAGFLLNNQLTDFSVIPVVDEKLVANRVEAGKRPRSSMSPTMVFSRDGTRLQHVIGSPGGSRIINYVALSLIGLMDWQQDVQTAIDMPRITNRNTRTALEQGTVVEEVKAELEARGHEVEVRDLNSGLHGISLRPDGKLEGGADPRREGAVAGG